MLPPPHACLPITLKRSVLDAGLLLVPALPTYTPMCAHTRVSACLQPAELKASVRFQDARRAVAEAKAHGKAKAAAAVQATNTSWAARLAAAQAEQELLQQQLRDMEQQRDTLESQVGLQNSVPACGLSTCLWCF